MSIPGTPSGIQTTDLNSDGIADLIVSIANSSELILLRNTGNATFEQSTIDFGDGRCPQEI